MKRPEFWSVFTSCTTGRWGELAERAVSGLRARARARVAGESFWTTRSFCTRADAWIIVPRRHPRGLDGSRWFQNGVFEPTEMQPLVGESIKRCARDQVDAFWDIFRACPEQCPKRSVFGRCGVPGAPRRPLARAFLEPFFVHFLRLQTRSSRRPIMTQKSQISWPAR